MNKKQLTVVMLAIAYFSPTYGMEREIEQPTAPEMEQLIPSKGSDTKTSSCEEQQYWVVELNKAYRKKYYMPIGQESRKFKKMWNTLPLEKKQEIANLMVQKRIIKATELDEHKKLTLHDTALMKKNGWSRVTLVPRYNNLLPRTLNLKAFEESKNSNGDITKALFLQQLATISEQRSSGRKLSQLTHFVMKDCTKEAGQVASTMTQD